MPVRVPAILLLPVDAALLMPEGKNFMTRQRRDAVWRRPDGMLVERPACDLTISRLKNGFYRCFDCPGVAGNWVCVEVEDMILHAVDHMLAGSKVPADKVKRLVDELGPRRAAVRRRSAG